MISRLAAGLLIVCLLAGCGNRRIEPLVSVSEAAKAAAAALAGEVSEARLRADVENIFNTPRYYTSERFVARQSIIAEVAGLNYVRTTQVFVTGEYDGCNVVLTKTGSVSPNTWVIVMAHYDSVSTAPGADDNGSGCAGLLEIARLLANTNFVNTIKLVFVDEEEPGLLGSQYFVAQIPAGTTVLAALVLEMIGYTSPIQQNPFPAPFDSNVGDFLVVLGDGNSLATANDFVRNLRQGDIDLPTIIISPDRIINNDIFADLLRSDHAWFWLEGLPAIMVGDTANFRNANYHQTTDTADTLDYAFLKKVTQAAVVSTCLWAKLE